MCRFENIIQNYIHTRKNVIDYMNTNSKCMDNDDYESIDGINKNYKQLKYNILYNKNEFKHINYLKTTKLEFTKYLNLLKKNLLYCDEKTNECYNNSKVEFIIKNELTNKYLVGNIQFIYENFDKINGDEYSYYYNDTYYTKKFENNIVLKFIEIYCILNGVIKLENSNIDILNIMVLKSKYLYGRGVGFLDKNLVSYNKLENSNYKIMDYNFDTIENKKFLLENYNKLFFNDIDKFKSNLITYNNNRNMFSAKLDYAMLFYKSKIKTIK
jgi:hypothetical protein